MVTLKTRDGLMEYFLNEFLFNMHYVNGDVISTSIKDLNLTPVSAGELFRDYCNATFTEDKKAAEMFGLSDPILRNDKINDYLKLKVYNK